MWWGLTKLYHHIHSYLIACKTGLNTAWVKFILVGCFCKHHPSTSSNTRAASNILWSGIVPIAWIYQPSLHKVQHRSSTGISIANRSWVLYTDYWSMFLKVAHAALRLCLHNFYRYQSQPSWYTTSHKEKDKENLTNQSLYFITS